MPIFDLLPLSLPVVTGGSFDGQTPAYLLLFNPTDIFRVLNVSSLDQPRGLHGPVSIVSPTLGNPWAMGATMLAWIAASLALAAWRFRI